MNAILPQRIPKKAKRTERYRSPAHRKHVKGYACCNCGYIPPAGEMNQGAHVRLGSHTPMGETPDDWRVVPLCGPRPGVEGCHGMQHRIGEATFWNDVAKRDPETLIEALIHASPKRREIEQAMKERENG